LVEKAEKRNEDKKKKTKPQKKNGREGKMDSRGGGGMGQQVCEPQKNGRKCSQRNLQNF